MANPTGRIPQSQWPKPFLLQIFERAVKEGCIRVGPQGLDAERAGSLIGALNRIRRRSDKQHTSFIRPEYHLISTTWEPDRGTLLVTYSSLPDGHSLPQLQGISEDEKKAMPVPQPAAPDETPLLEAPAGVSFDADTLVDELLAKEAARLTGGN